MLMGQTLSPTVGNRAAGDQAGAGRQRWAATDMVPVLVNLPAQLIPVRCALLVALLVDLPVAGWQRMISRPVARAGMLLAMAVMITSQVLLTIMVSLLLVLFESLAMLMGFARSIGSRSGLGQRTQQCRCGEETDDKVT